jgi:hypothetical protein
MQLMALLEHFWENRALARGIFQGAARHKTTAVLVRLIEGAPVAYASLEA